MLSEDTERIKLWDNNESGAIKMKKNLSRIFGAVIICMLALTLNATAFAAENAAGFTIKYDDNGANGTVPSDGREYFAGEFALVAGAGELSKGDSVFVGWSRTPGAASADYIPGDKIKIQDDTTLYSVWTAKNAPAQTVIISNSGKIQHTSVSTMSYFPDRSFISGN